MYVGIYDQDLFEEKVFKPNLETMQISTMCKQQNHIVELIVDLNKIEKYDKIYLVKTKVNTKFLSNLICDSRVITVGIGFTNGNYIGYPEFEKLPADTTIYNRYFLGNFKISKANKERFERIKNAEHTRLSFGNNEIVKNQIKLTSRSLYLYDNNLEQIEKGYQYLTEIGVRKVHFVRPNRFQDFELIQKWVNNEWNVVTNSFIYENDLSNTEFRKYIASVKEHNKTITFLIRETDSPTQNKKEFEKWLDRSLYASTRKKNFLLLREDKNPFDYYNTLFRKFWNWHIKEIRNKSFNEYFTSKKDRQLFDIMCKKNYNINIMVNLVPKDFIARGGVWHGC